MPSEQYYIEKLYSRLSGRVRVGVGVAANICRDGEGV
jgi:hypothetical protein